MKDFKEIISIKLDTVNSLVHQANSGIEDIKSIVQDMNGIDKEYSKYLNFIQYKLEQLDEIITELKGKFSPKGLHL